MRALAQGPRVALLSAGLHLALLATAHPALADEPSPPPPPANPGAAAGKDTIHLKSGGLLRGTLIDVIPGDHARIELVTHDVVTVAWADVLRVDRGDEATPPAVPAPPANGTNAGAARTAPASTPGVTIRIEGSDDAELQQDVTGDGDWQVVCEAPCNKAFSTSFDYRIKGPGIRASNPFALHAEPGGTETLHVNPASSQSFGWGVVAAAVGGAVAYVGFFVGIFGSFGYTSRDNGQTVSHPPDPGLASAGWTMLGVGGAAAAGGLVLLLSNRRTGVVQQGGTDASPSEALRAPSPTWHEVSSVERTVPAALTFPVLGTTF